MPITCTRKLAAALNGADCVAPPVGGIEDVITIMNWADYQLATIAVNATNEMIVETFTPAATTAAYQMNFIPETATATATRNGINTYDHSITGMMNINSNTLKKALMDADGGRYVVIVENRNPVAEKKFEIYGMEAGLTITALTQDANANNGAIPVTFASSEFSKETKLPKSLFKTDLATTRAIIETLKTVVP